eukprot:312414_1
MAAQSNSDEELPIKFTVVEHIRAQQQSATFTYSQPNITNSDFMHVKTHKKNVIDVNQSVVQNIYVEAKVENISKHPQWGDDLDDDEDAPIINCIGRVYFRIEDKDKNDEDAPVNDVDDDEDAPVILCSGTGTVIRKLGKNLYCNINMCTYC